MPKLAFIFPGQGSQSLGLLRSLAQHFSIIKNTFLEASQVLGYDMWALVEQGPLAKINQTIYTQPIILTASTALWRLWREQSPILPNFLAGHSLGEYAAYGCAGSISFKETLQLVAQRASYMQAAIAGQEGAMAAIIGLNAQTVRHLCYQAHDQGYVAPASYNAPLQIIVSGDVNGVNYLIYLAKQSGAKLAKKLSISVPAHCLLMKPAGEHLTIALEKIAFLSPQIPVLDTIQVELTQDIQTIKKSLLAQLYHPVRWSDSIQWLMQQGVDCFIECGPGQVLSNLVKQIGFRNITTISLAKYKGFHEALAYVSCLKH